MIRSLREVDFGRFLELARGESWSCDEAELAAFLAVLPDGCLVLEQRARPVGFVMAYRHERSVWIGNFIVDPAWRGSGLGTRLLEALLDRLDVLVPTVYLNAAPAATKLYRQHGFRPLGSVSRWQLRSSKDGAAPARGVVHRRSQGGLARGRRARARVRAGVQDHHPRGRHRADQDRQGRDELHQDPREVMGDTGAFAR